MAETEDKLKTEITEDQVWKRERETTHGSVKSRTFYRTKYVDDEVVLMQRVVEEETDDGTEYVPDSEGAGHTIEPFEMFEEKRDGGRMKYVAEVS